jgi:uncharacterized protein DUF4350
MRRIVPLVLAALAFLAFGILWIVTDRRASQRVYDEYSSANTSPEGLSLAAGYLAKHRKVGTLTQSLARTPIEPNAVIFRVAGGLVVFFDPEDLDPKQFGPPKPKEQPLLNDAEEAFVRKGGRMIIAAPSGLLDSEDAKPAVAHKVFPIWPGVGDLDPKGEHDPDCKCETLRVFTTLRPRMHALFTMGSRAILARERIGNGELFVLSTPDLLANKYLAKKNHLALLAALAGDGRPVYFDEVLHGIVSDEGSLALMKDWNLGPFLLLLGAIALLVFWREGRRIGPPDAEERDTRSDAIDLVRSLGALYRGVTSDAEAIALYHEALTKTVAHQSGLRGDALRKRVDELTGGLVPTTGRGSMPAGVFRRQLDIINQGFTRIMDVHRERGGRA